MPEPSPLSLHDALPIYAFRAHYNGDANFDASTSACEPFHVNTAASSTATELHNNANEAVIPLGSSVRKSTRLNARQLGTSYDDFCLKTSTVTFTFFSNG